MKYTVIIRNIAVFVFLATLAHFNSAMASVENGTPAPAFTLQGSDGNSHSLDDYKGKIIVLEWFNHLCPFVRKHYDSGNMQSLQKTYTAKDVVWLSVISSAPGKQGYVSPEEAQANTTNDNASPTAVLLDPSGDTGRLYGAKTTPHMFIINTEGTLVYQGAIDSINSADKADIAKAEKYVVNALDETLAGEAVTVASTKQYGCTVKY